MIGKYKQIGCLAALAVFPAILGGDLNVLGWAAFLTLLAVYYLIFKPKADFPKYLKIAVAIVLLWPLLGLLPAVWQPSWRNALFDLGVDLPWTWHLQPWVLVNAWLMGIGVGLWAYAALSISLSVSEARSLMFTYALLVCLIALTALLERFSLLTINWWEQGLGLGPFLNRNHSGSLYAITFLLSLGLASHYVRGKEKNLFVVCLMMSALLFVATALNGSRAGVLLLVSGGFFWALWRLIFFGEKKESFILAGVAGLILAGLLFFGGEALERVVRHLPGQASGPGTLLGGRWEIWVDTWQLFKTLPIFGVGLGNFEGVFPLFRESLIVERRVIHPESDWVWWIVELGVIGLFAILVLICCLTIPALQDIKTRGRRIRSAAFIASGLFLMHGFFDVAAHRVGALVPVFLMLRLAWPNQRKSRGHLENSKASRWTIVTVVSLLAIATWFALPSVTTFSIPSIGFQEKAKEAFLNRKEGEGKEVTLQVEKAMHQFPLDWELRFYYAMGQLVFFNQEDEAWKHFSIARALETTSSETAFYEGTLWIARNPSRSWIVWREALQRRHLDIEGLFAKMLKTSVARPELYEALVFLGVRTPNLRYLVLSDLPDDEFDGELKYLLDQDRDPDRIEDVWMMRHVLQTWANRKGNDPVADYVEQHSEWIFVGWPYVVQRSRESGASLEAYQLLKSLIPKPKYPELSSSPERLKYHLKQLLTGSKDPISLYYFLKFDPDAFTREKTEQIVSRVLDQERMPAYLYFLAAEYFAQNDQWNKAVIYLSKYVSLAQE
ncbi:MAG: O-antigen ligase family protein [Verrucomicrobiota bacterium]